MPILGFTGETSVGPFYETIPKGIKTQTCRKPRKRPIKVGDKLYLYWKLRTKRCRKIGEAICSSVERKHYLDFAWDGEFAKREGCKDFLELQEFFGDPKIYGAEEYDVISWKDFKPAGGE